jgi:outer membrane protein assembly factor BamA
LLQFLTHLIFFSFCDIHPSNAQKIDSCSIQYLMVDKDNPYSASSLKLKTSFPSRIDANSYISSLPSTLLKQGFTSASIDSNWIVDKNIFLKLYLGQKIESFTLNTDSLEKEVKLNAAVLLRQVQSKLYDSSSFALLQNAIVEYYGNNGHPFASVYLDDVKLNASKLQATIKVNKGLLYKIDSIRILGTANLNKGFLSKHLSIPNNSLYATKKLELIDKKLSELPYIESVQPSDILMLGTGAVVNVYLQQKKSNQIDFLIGFLPNATVGGKTQLTGDIKFDLKNALGNGENFLFKWQSLQPRSPRLNIGFEQPYILKSSFGVNFLFDLYKRDSNYRQVNAEIGTQFRFQDNQIGKLFLRVQDNSILQGAIDTNRIRLTKALPADADITSLSAGLAYELAKTNYRFNPRSGSELVLNTSIGTKKVKVNNEIAQIKDPNFNFASLYDSILQKTYQVRVHFKGAHYFPVGKRAVVKTGANAGWLASPNIFRNELFLIGGSRLLRGFNEEAFFAKQYAVGTIEYRYLTARNSHVYTFVDIAAAQNRLQNLSVDNQFFSAGIGIVNETKFGLLNLSFAAGKRNDIPFNIREAVKLHFGYINFF